MNGLYSDGNLEEAMPHYVASFQRIPIIPAAGKKVVAGSADCSTSASRNDHVSCRRIGAGAVDVSFDVGQPSCVSFWIEFRLLALLWRSFNAVEGVI